MPVTITINDTTKQALAFLEYAKSLSFVKFKDEKNALAKPEVLDEDGLTAEDKKFITALSQKTKKAAARRFYKKISQSTSL